MAIDWKSDPIFMKLRAEFLESFPERLVKVQRFSKALRSSSFSEEGPLFQLNIVVHSLAGAAESYGFSTLTQIAGALDDFLSEIFLRKSSELFHKAEEFCELLGEALSDAIRIEDDPKSFLKDQRLATLTSFCESLLVGSKL